MTKPIVGDSVAIIDPDMRLSLGFNVGIVTEVHESYDMLREIWEAGEDAWAAADADPEGIAEWYALVVDANGDHDDIWIVCSFECGVVS